MIALLFACGGSEAPPIAWTAPAGESGVWKVGVAPALLLPQVRVLEEGLPDGTIVKLPDAIPAELPAVAAGEYLVLVGDVAGSDLLPLVPSGPRTFGTAEAPRAFTQWKYFGEPVTVPRGKDGKPTWIAADAVPAGDYGVPIGRRAVLVHFGG